MRYGSHMDDERIRDDHAGDDTAVRAAREVLRANDRGRYTVPARGLYPHQWNWDSALAALGWATIDPDRAWTELESLVAARHATGMVAHIAFDPTATTYQPGPQWWGDLVGADGRRISGISQPPVAATCARLLFERVPDEHRARGIVTALAAWHRFLLTERDPGGLGEPVVVHPWETGRDNAPEWDAALERAPVAGELFRRVDTGFVDAAHRPTDDHYARYAGLVEEGRYLGWNQLRLAQVGSFRMLDPAFGAMLAAGCADLAWLAGELGEAAIADASWHQAQAVGAALAARADSDGLVWPVDLAGGSEVARTTCAQALIVMAPDLPRASVDAALDLVAPGGELASDLGVCSTSRLDAAFAPDTYWRGPVWANVTWLVALGAERHGRTGAASDLLERLRRFAGAAGMREYANPDSGEGRGADDFTWTAALSLWEAGRPAARAQGQTTR